MANTVDGIIMGSTLNSITGDFIGNRAGTFGGAICNVSEGTINEINGLFISNTASDNGGAIFNEGKIVTINADYIGNQTIKNGGAIANHGGVFDTIAGDFIGNAATENGGAIWNRNIINSVSGSFMGNIANEYGGAIYQQNGATIGIIADTSSVKIMGNTDANEGTPISDRRLSCSFLTASWFFVVFGLDTRSTREDDELRTHDGIG